MALPIDWKNLARRRFGLDAAAMAAGGLTAWLWLGGLDGSLAALWWIACVVVIRSDIDHYIIPDEASRAIATAGLVEAAVRAWAEGADFAGALGGALLQGCVGFALLWLVATLHRVATGREGLGFGDVKLGGACALWLDLADQAAALEIAAVAAIALVLLSRRSRDGRGAAIPFGAFLAPAAWLVFVFGPALHAMLDRWP